ncbi:MAG: hypothetical protein KDC67_01285, partial [Ignavibacteriae bacterium]|nr:hypothetical protein [Ignavibacteriota bacterium]
MSWLFGILQKRKLLSLEFNCEEEFQKAETDNFSFIISKNNHSTFLNTSQNKIQALVGIPILDDKGKKKLFTNSDFKKPDLLQQEYLFGHFVFLNYSNNNLEIFNDTFGLRDLYYIDSEEQFIFSTRIDLLSKYTSNSEINSIEFSSLWLTNFQLSNNSIHQNIKRLGPAGKIIFNGSEIKISNKKFEKNEIKNPHELFSETIDSYSSIKNVDSKTISLGLSGGIDSRLILASLLNSENIFSCYSLVNEETNDLKISEKICEIFSIEHKLIFRENLNIADREQEIIQYYKTIPPVIPLTQLLDFGFYGKEYLSKFLLLDGGFGEFYRRQFLKKIFLKGYKIFSVDNFS